MHYCKGRRCSHLWNGGIRISYGLDAGSSRELRRLYMGSWGAQAGRITAGRHGKQRTDTYAAHTDVVIGEVTFLNGIVVSLKMCTGELRIGQLALPHLELMFKLDFSK